MPNHPPKHSTLPWRVEDGHIFSGKRQVANCRGYSDGDPKTPAVSHANAAFIVQACNAFEGLEKALNSLANEVSGALGIAEYAIREAIGHTNVACIQTCLGEARLALAATERKG